MIEILGYISLWLIVGVVLLPFSAVRGFVKEWKPLIKLSGWVRITIIIFWPVMMLASLWDIWVKGYKLLNE